MRAGQQGYKGNGKYGQGYKGGGTGKDKGGGYRSFGKAVGKGLNYYGQEDYWDVWGDGYYHDYDEWTEEVNDYNYIGNVAMMLEQGGMIQKRIRRQ